MKIQHSASRIVYCPIEKTPSASRYLSSVVCSGMGYFFAACATFTQPSATVWLKGDQPAGRPRVLDNLLVAVPKSQIRIPYVELS